MDGIRLQKYIAMCGVASRRKAEGLIEKGIVSVNNKQISIQGYRVLPGDQVAVNGKEIHLEEKKIYILLNKPRGVVSTVSDEKGRKTVLDCISGVTERLYPVGRLDYNTTGLIILTNDGGFTKYMTHPSHQVSKTYLATTDVNPREQDIEVLQAGVDIGGYTTAPAEVETGRFKQKRTAIKITICEGKNRQVRRMLEAVGLRVRTLARISIGNIADSKLKAEEWRYLSLKEIEGLGYDTD